VLLGVGAWDVGGINGQKRELVVGVCARTPETRNRSLAI